MKNISVYKPINKIRIVTAASLFDGHDAAINIMRRIIQATGVEVIHLGHDRSVEEVVNCAIQEDANAIAMTSYQGGHNEYFKYMCDLLKEKGASHIKIFGGGGGVILPSEIEELMQYGITRIYSPDDVSYYLFELASQICIRKERIVVVAHSVKGIERVNSTKPFPIVNEWNNQPNLVFVGILQSSIKMDKLISIDTVSLNC